MSFDETKTDKVRIRLTPSMGVLAREFARDNEIELQDALRMLAKAGLRFYGYIGNGQEVPIGRETTRDDAQTDMRVSGAAPHRGPFRRTVTRRERVG